jgi:hypothetical protein
MLNVLPVVMLVAAAAVLIGVIAVAMGRGGELAFFQPDYAPLNLDEVSSTDIALFRPPAALWGYSMNVTDEALTRIATAITERDIEIATLQQQVADLQSAAASRRGYGPSERTARTDPAARTDPTARTDPAGFQGERAATQRGERTATQNTGRSVWEPSTPAAQETAETPSSGGWAALPKRSPGSSGQTARDDEEDER